MDPYALLGVTRAASAADIERAYRRLVRRYHPGVNPGDRVAEQAYARVQDAYALLTDARRRREYDRGGASAVPVVEASVAFEGFDFSTPAEGPLAATFSELFADVFQQAARDATAAQPLDIEADVRVSFVDAMRGAAVPISVTRRVACGACEGTGARLRAASVCPACEGTGERRWARGHMVFTRTCDGCGGVGRLARERCHGCRGTGVATRSEVVTVQVPAGVEPSARIAVPGRGHVGRGEVGDLYARVVVDRHPFFRRVGRDVHVTVPVGVHEAALGGVVEVPTLDGSVRVRIPPGTPSGRQLRLREDGAVSGDLVVEIQIVVPARLDARSRALLEEFGRRHDATGDRRAAFESHLEAPASGD